MESKLPAEALVDLRQVLIKEIGPERTSGMSEDDLDHIGKFFLTTMAIGIKMKLRNATQKEETEP